MCISFAYICPPFECEPTFGRRTMRLTEPALKRHPPLKPEHSVIVISPEWNKFYRPLYLFITICRQVWFLPSSLGGRTERGVLAIWQEDFLRAGPPQIRIRLHRFLAPNCPGLFLQNTNRGTVGNYVITGVCSTDHLCRVGEDFFFLRR